ncbi:YbgA family protein [Desulfosarcina sp.]|uniref:YbgA family protein n=1 Tax=Desulfosarcina sp. TaxID=2027861 RepID=UPI00397075E8
MTSSIKIGVSACLLGEKVRFDGGHKHNRYITQTLGLFFDFVPVCPESECGLGIPREAMRLVGDVNRPRLVTNKTSIDHTEKMLSWAAGRLDGLAKEDLCGFIFKKDSPSSGLHRVKVYNEKGQPVKSGRGLFAAAFTDRFPRIPVEEEGRLHDPVLRENFIEQVFALKRWRQVLEKKKTMGSLVAFHTREKLLLMAHSPKNYREMGQLVAAGKRLQGSDLYDQYEGLLLDTLGLRATISKHTNVLMHILGYFKKQLSADEKKEVLELINDYRNCNMPLIVPVTLLNHFVRKYNQPYLAEQTYLRPHPVDLQLRNHV